MSMESVSWEHKVTLLMPFKKRKVSTEWPSGDLPSIPIMQNQKALKKQVRLMVYLPEKKKENQDNKKAQETKKK